MTQIASLPVLSVQIAYTPTNIYSTTQSWTDITAYVRDFRTTSGRQHMLDRMESSTLTMTLDTRSGGFDLLRSRLPIKVTATWSGTTYPIYYGLTDNIDTRLQDWLNTDVTVQASDYLKQLSLRYMNNADLWPAAANSASATNWYRFDSTTNTIPDAIGTQNGTVTGNYVLADGAMLYDVSKSIDLTNGTGSDVATFLTPYVIGNGTGSDSLDFWVKGVGITNQTLLSMRTGSTSGGVVTYTDYSIDTNSSGLVSAGTINSNIAINDGQWHHIGFIAYAGYALTLIVDGKSFTGSGVLASTGSLYAPANVYGYPFAFDGDLDEVVMSANCSSGASALAEITNRYYYGALMQGNTSTADQIADVLVASGIVTQANLTSRYKYNGGTYAAGTYGTQQMAGWTTPVTGSTVLDLILLACDTETGAFFQQPDGTFNFNGKDYVYLPANHNPQFVITDYDGNYTNETYYDASTLQLTNDDMDTWTTVAVTPTVGDTQTYTNTTNQPLYGYTTLTKSTQGLSSAQALAEAQFLGLLYQKPLTRVGQVELLSETNNGADLPFMLNAYLGERITFRRTNLLTPGGPYTSEMTTEAIIHTFNADPGFWHTQFTLDPYPLSPENQLAINFLVFNNTTYGIIGNYVSTTTGSLNVAGATSLYVTSATGTGTSVIKANMDLSVGVPGSTTFESVIVSSSYTSGTTIPITTPLLYTHASGVAVVSANSIQ